ncbi:hypothetical protein N5C90_16915 [Pseudomonas aeruginosa]|uniref:hypothetical protein n=1 Tax=Pseudomonas aeruginosa TaxID=287 RepID=UPI00244B7AC3|nr:hypothetical protein [Pseudomonas aeruginosa]MDG9825461.1 hypothetical protein [Pseudomonas aeruginosa]MDH0406494.1 hypothetical protein [Pseudomonas aeruginosa]MDH1016406.1 hypothetical protein [Pseudomonas aeruginosa]
MSSTQHQLIEQCATRLRGIVDALDNIHDTSPHRWSTDLDDVHSSAESLLAMIKDQAPTQAAQGLARAALAQPYPAQDEQAEAERPEVVARDAHSNPVVLDHCGPLNANDELMTVAQHAASVARWAEMFNRVEQERDAALARVAELEKQEPVGEVRESGGTLTAVIVRHSYATKLPVGTKLYAAPVAQAQHSVPEEFSFEYRHPNGECHTVTVSREQVINEMPDFLFEALCSKFCNCEPVGETNVVECCCDEYAEEFKLIAAAPGKEVPQAWLDVQAERRRQVEAEGWTPEHDDAHSHGQMARAAACYALAGSSAPNDGTAALLVSLAWPWDEQWWKPTTTRRDLVKACALGLAEIERLDRAGISQNPQPGATTASS